MRDWMLVGAYACIIVAMALIIWMIGIGAMLCLTFWGGMAFAFWVMG